METLLRIFVHFTEVEAKMLLSKLFLGLKEAKKGLTLSIKLIIVDPIYHQGSTAQYRHTDNVFRNREAI